MITAQEEYEGWQSDEDMDVAEGASSSGVCVCKWATVNVRIAVGNSVGLALV